jgi:Ca2+-binding RTX toxin-like protein
MDRMYGGAGNDKLDAGPAGPSSPFNHLFGQEGDDTLLGGPDILSKLSVRSRVEAAAAAHRLGLVEP